MAITHSHKLVLPSDANHHGTLYAGAMLRLVLEAGYATAWKHVGPEANLVLHRTAAYLVCGLVGAPWDDGGTWVEALFGFAQVTPEGKLAHFPDRLPNVVVPAGETWERLTRRMNKLLRTR